MNKKDIIAVLALALCTVLCIVCASALSRDKKTENNPAQEDFSFALTWGCYGISSYDSATGKLVKTTDATHPEDYVTEYRLTEAERQQIQRLIRELDLDGYPSRYDPNPDVSSEPSMTLILTARTAEGEKTVRAENIAIMTDAKDARGRKFLDACRAIEELLYATDAWQALPEYEYFYE